MFMFLSFQAWLIDVQPAANGRNADNTRLMTPYEVFGPIRLGRRSPARDAVGKPECLLRPECQHPLEG
jgi:hypothetical protein